MPTQKTNKTKIQVISRAANILRTLGSSSLGVSLGQLSIRCDLPRSTVQRIVESLTLEGLVVHLGENQGFTLGPEIQALAACHKVDVWRTIHPHLKSLAHMTGETVDLAVLQGKEMLFVDQIPGRHRLRAMSEPGERFSAFTTANGKACLSLSSDKQLTEEYRVDEALMEELRKVRQTGLAWDIDEHTPGISAVGSAFKGLDGQRYAVSIPVPSQRFESIRQELAPKLLECVVAIRKLKEHIVAI